MLLIFLPNLGMGGSGTLAAIRGVTRDATGAPLAGCVVHLFRTADDVKIGTTTSDAGGNYAFLLAPGIPCYCVAYLAGTPDRCGTTINTLEAA